MALAKVFYRKKTYSNEYLVEFGDPEGETRHWPAYTTTDKALAQKYATSQLEAILTKAKNIHTNGFPDGSGVVFCIEHGSMYLYIINKFNTIVVRKLVASLSERTDATKKQLDEAKACHIVNASRIYENMIESERLAKPKRGFLRKAFGLPGSNEYKETYND